MPNFRLVLGGAAFALLAAACGGVAASPTNQQNNDEATARQVRAVLTQANEVASDYGRKHLGHYLRFNTAKLTARLEVPEGIQLDVLKTHTSYCIKARTASLPASHAWAIATAGPKATEPSPHDRCPKGRY